MYLDYAERQARRGNIMYMQDWVNRLDAFLQFNEEDILHDKGKVTAAIAKAFAESEFENSVFCRTEHIRVISTVLWQISKKTANKQNKSGNDVFIKFSSFCIDFQRL